jgi:cell division protease FtsH
MARSKLNDITVKSDYGDFQIESTQVYDLVKKCVEDTKNLSDLLKTKIDDYFEGDRIDNYYYSLGSNETPTYLKCFHDILERDFKIDKIVDFDFKRRYEVPPTYHEFEIDRDIKETMLIKGSIFASDKMGNKFVFNLIPYTEDYSIELECYFDSSKIKFKDFWKKVEDYFDKEGPLKNEKIDSNWNFIKYEPKDWDNIVISEEHKKMIDRHIINFIGLIDDYKEKRLPASRGILISGPPGTGKTLCCETIMGMVDATIIYVTSDSIESVGQIKNVYKLARRLSPSIVIIEDIDTLGGLDRRERGNHPLLGEFLNCLSGVGGNDGVITIATTNYPQNIDIALGDRPGRFDLRIQFDYPDKELRGHILNKYLEEFNTSKLNIDKIVKETENMSGAYLKEIIMVAYMISIEYGSKKITQKIINEAFNSVKQLKRTVNKSYGIKIMGDKEETLYS